MLLDGRDMRECSVDILAVEDAGESQFDIAQLSFYGVDLRVQRKDVASDFGDIFLRRHMLHDMCQHLAEFFECRFFRRT